MEHPAPGGVRISIGPVISTDAEGAPATEEEWRDPVDASSATAIRGVLPRLCVLSFVLRSTICATDFITNFGSTFSPAELAHFTSESPGFSRSAFISTNTIPLRASPEIPVSSFGVLRKLPGRARCHRARKADQTLASCEEDCFDREAKSPLGRPCRKLGPRNAVPLTLH